MFDELGSRRHEPAERVEQAQDTSTPVEGMGMDACDIPKPDQPAGPWDDTSRQAPLEAGTEPGPLGLTETERALVTSTAESSGQISFEGARADVKCVGCVGTHTGTGIKIEIKS